MFNIFKCKHRGNYWMQQIGIWTTFFLYGQNYFSAAIKLIIKYINLLHIAYANDLNPFLMLFTCIFHTSEDKTVPIFIPISTLLPSFL